MQKLYLGIDWGTHSSKWACRIGQTHKYVPAFPLYSSALLRDGPNLVFSPPDDVEDEDLVIRSVKGTLIQDPLGQRFWSSEPRLDTGTSLGEAVAFSLCALLTDAKGRIIRELGAGTADSLDIGFSFPNWVVDPRKKYRLAAASFAEAVAVAVDLATRFKVRELPRPGRGFPINEWRELVREARSRISSAPGPELAVETITQQSLDSFNAETRWVFLLESGAAGLPYLRATEVERVPGAPGLAKLLVVDVGAGSTDAGYMLRVKNRQTGNEKFYYFHPASSFPEAGNVLTDEIIKYFSQRNQPLTIREAEARKLQRTDWTSLPFVQSWMRRICNHVREYVKGIPDHRWLPLPVSLNVVITGGSGLVPGLADGINEGIREAMKARGFRTAVDKIRLSSRHIPRLDFRTEAEYARRAVCLGAADFDKPGFQYMAKMEPPEATPRIQIPPRWV